MAEKVFDRSVCFSFFGDYKQTADEIEKECGMEAALTYYKALSNYALYDEEPALTGIVKILWPTTKTTIDSSIKRRRSGFGEDTDKSEEILQYKRDNPDATQRVIADAVGCSLGKVNKVLNNTDADSDASPCPDAYSNSVPPSNAIRERERERSRCAGEEEQRRTVYSLEDSELDEVARMYKARVGYKDICKKLGLPEDSLSKEVIAQIPDIKKHNVKERAERAGLELAEKLEANEPMLEKISKCSGFSKEDVLLHVSEIEEDVELVFEFFDKYVDGEDATFGWKRYEEEFFEDYDTYWKFIKMGIDANIRN